MLPRMSWGNWLFWSILFWCFFNLLWLKFMEIFLPQWVGAIISTLVAGALFRYAPRPKKGEE